MIQVFAEGARFILMQGRKTAQVTRADTTDHKYQGHFQINKLTVLV